jgi:hypothetical protein
MRSHKAVFALGFVVAVGVGLLLVGCSSDDLATGGTVTIDPQYDAVTGQVNQMVDSALALAAQSLDIFVESRSHTDSIHGEDNFQDFLEASADTVTIDGDWYVLINTDFQSAYTNYQIDSFIFLASGVPVTLAVTADAMLAKRALEIAYYRTDQSYNDYVVHSDFDFSGLNTNLGTVNGAVNLDGIIQDVSDGLTVLTTYEILAEFSSLVVDEDAGGWASGMPVSGSCEVTVGWTYKNGSAPEKVSDWTYDITFTDGEMQVEVTDGLVTTTYLRDLNQ